MHGKLAGTGKLVILPVDQGYEHGPARSFSPNPDAYDPHYHYKLAIDAGLNAYAAPLGMLEAGADTFAGQQKYLHQPLTFLKELHMHLNLHRLQVYSDSEDHRHQD